MLFKLTTEEGESWTNRTLPKSGPLFSTLRLGRIYWCQCGLSKNQPFCDGSHSGTKFEPLKLQIKAKQKVALCNCKRTKMPLLCDGVHARL